MDVVYTLLYTIIILEACWIILCTGQSSTNNEVFCSVKQASKLSLSNVGEKGVLMSQNYPGYMAPGTKDCQVDIEVCSHCRIKLTVGEISLQSGSCQNIVGQKGSCINGCNHIYLHEPDAPEHTTSYIHQGIDWENYSKITTTRRLYIKLCRAYDYSAIKFKFKIEVLEKIERVHLSDGYYVTSPFYPKQYSNHYGDDIYRYIFSYPDMKGFINLNFTDWNIFPDSQIKIYSDPGWNEPIAVYTGNHGRPVGSFNKNPLYMEFLTGQSKDAFDHSPFEPFMGFRVLASTTTAINLSYTDCGRYYKDIWTDTFTVNDRTFCKQPGYFDCVFVIAKARNFCFNDFILRLDRIHMELDNVLTIRQGSTSQGQVIAEFSAYHNRTGLKYMDSDAYYISFRGKCRTNQGTRFKAVFATYSKQVIKQWGTCSISNTFKCQNEQMYLPNKYTCDGIIHCDDESDEKNCGTTVNTSSGSVTCSWNEKIGCGGSSFDKYCPIQKCDGVMNCRYGEDEKECVSGTTAPSDKNLGFAYSWGTVVPVALVCVVVGFIMCLLISMFTRMRKARRNAREEALRRRQLQFLNGFDWRTAMDSPPTYDDAVFHPVPPPTGEYTNSAYIMDNYPQPPPYTPPIESTDNASIPAISHSILPNQHNNYYTQSVDQIENPCENREQQIYGATTHIGHDTEQETGPKAHSKSNVVDRQKETKTCVQPKKKKHANSQENTKITDGVVIQPSQYIGENNPIVSGVDENNSEISFTQRIHAESRSDTRKQSRETTV